MDKIDVVIQGNIWPRTLVTANYYLGLPFVDGVIISTWDNEHVHNDNSRIRVVYSEMPEPVNTRACKINFQLVSSLAGIKVSDSDIIVKTRSDQQIHHDSWHKFYAFWQEHKHKNEIDYLNGVKRKAPVFVIGMNKIFPYHPQDHLQWGYHEDIEKIFDVPLMPDDMNRELDFSRYLRGPIYIGARYYERFNELAGYHLANWGEYLLDGAPKFKEAMDNYNTIRDKVFRVFPRVNMYWEKYHSNYWFDCYEPQGEYYAD